MSDPGQRAITIYCDGKWRGRDQHDPVDVAALLSDPRHEPERWILDDRAEHQQLVHPDDADASPAVLQWSGHVANRFKIECRLCGYDVTLGDAVGTGYTTMTAKRATDAQGAGYRTKPARRPADRLTPTGEHTTTAPVPAKATTGRPDIDIMLESLTPPIAAPDLHEKLSAWADSGMSRLPMSVLRRIIEKSS